MPRLESMCHPSSVNLIVFDVDGVLTDGGIYVDDRGTEFKRFHVRDGLAIKAAMAIGLQVGILTGRSSPAVTLRTTELGIDLVVQGSHDKGADLETICRRASIPPKDVAFLGDDLVDLPAMARCGYRMAVADAVEEVRAVAHYVTEARGGQAAVREAIEHVLKEQGRWGEVLARCGV